MFAAASLQTAATSFSHEASLNTPKRGSLLGDGGLPPTSEQSDKINNRCARASTYPSPRVCPLSQDHMDLP